jgi:hypothetical protein
VQSLGGFGRLLLTENEDVVLIGVGISHWHVGEAGCVTF